MPRPNKPRTIGAEDSARDHIRTFLAENERSGAWFARQMQRGGCSSFTDATLWKILNAGRTIYVEEAVVMAGVLGVSVTELAS